MERRRASWVVFLVLGVLLTAVAATIAIKPEREDKPPAAAGLLPWTPRGAFHTDHALLAEAVAAWRTGRLADGSSARAPTGEAYVLWAGKIGAGRLVVLKGLDADGTPLVAQVAEHGDPATLGLDAVDELPVDASPALAVTYDGNLKLPGLSAGAGAALVQLLEAPTSDTDQRALWRQTGSGEGNQLELLEMRDESMTETFLHLGGDDDPPTRVVVGSVGVRVGILTTIDVRPNQLVPTPSAVSLADGEPWGPSGRVDGGEYTDTVAAAEAVGAEAAKVSEIVAGSSTGGPEIVARLLQVDTDSGRFRALVARDAVGDLACLSVEGPLATAPDETAAERLVAQQCIDPSRSLWVVAVAATPGAGPVSVSGVDGALVEEPTERLVVAMSSAQRATVVAALDRDPSESVTFAPAAGSR